MPPARSFRQAAQRFRLAALLCAAAVLLCELLSRPFVEMGLCDDWPYILSAQKLATTGHLAYAGSTTPFLGWQLYLGDLFIKLFGFSLTTVRMSTLLISLVLAFLLHRTLVRAGITERNATFATLALVLSPLYLLLSVTFMTDIAGLFGILLCLYGCLRALQSRIARSSIAWLCFAVTANALFGSSRQIAWLGILVMVPSALWLLRSRRPVLLAGAVANLLGILFVFACMRWFQHQPYNVHEPLLPNAFPLADTFERLFQIVLDIPFLLLPVAALFLPQLRKLRPTLVAVLWLSLLGYLVLAIHPSHLRHIFQLEPTAGDWVNVHGIFEDLTLKGAAPVFLSRNVRILFTLIALGGALTLLALLFTQRDPPTAHPAHTPARLSLHQLGLLLAPLAVVYLLLLVPRAAVFHLTDRYLFPLLLLSLLFVVRFYQDRIEQDRIELQIPLAAYLLIAVMALYGVVVTHNLFAFYRARLALAQQLHAAGLPDTSIDNGWEYNIGTELHHAAYLNDPRIVVPAHAYTPPPPLPASTCSMWGYDNTPHIKPVVGISFDPNACYGPAPYAPIHYSRWFASTQGTLYVVRYTP